MRGKPSIIFALSLLAHQCSTFAFLHPTPISRVNVGSQSRRQFVVNSELYDKALNRQANLNIAKYNIVPFSHGKLESRQCRFSSTSLQMGYNLPPSGGGGGGGIKEVIPGILTIAGLTLFFISPLGGIFFAITNTFFLLALLTPFILTVGFQAWQYFNTIEGDCPSCGAPVRVMKDDEGQPNFCLSCGSLVRANADKDGVELCNDPNSIFDPNGVGGAESIFDNLFGGGGGIVSEEVYTTTATTTRSSGKDKARRERTVIDVDIEDDQ